jgi:excinuclease ABC subunit A
LGLINKNIGNFAKVKPTLYILEEPTIGLHTADCKKLILLIHRLVDEGNTVIVIEHDVDIIAEADFLFELGTNRRGKWRARSFLKGQLHKFYQTNIVRHLLI